MEFWSNVRNGIDLRVTKRSLPSLKLSLTWSRLTILWQSRIKHQGIFTKHGAVQVLDICF